MAPKMGIDTAFKLIVLNNYVKTIAQTPAYQSIIPNHSQNIDCKNIKSFLIFGFVAYFSNIYLKKMIEKPPTDTLTAKLAVPPVLV